MSDLELLIQIHNEMRKTKPWFRKLEPLVADKSLMRYAKTHAKWMAKNNKMIHSSMKDILNLGFNNAGENIAWGQPDAKSVMRTWMLSAGHRANILGYSYKKIGCYAEADELGKLYWCVVFAA